MPATKDKFLTNNNKDIIENLFRDRAIGSHAAFEDEGEKTSGLSAGKIVKEKDTGKTFMLKKFYKDAAIGEKVIIAGYEKNQNELSNKINALKDYFKEHKNTRDFPDKNFLYKIQKALPFDHSKNYQQQIKELSTKDIWSYLCYHDINQMKLERLDAVQELMAFNIYESVLYDRTPKGQLVESDKDKPLLYIRSKFLENAITLSEFTGSEEPTWLGEDTAKLKQITGFEKAVAACHLLGEIDYHAGNLMVQTQKEENENDLYTVAKIDHLIVQTQKEENENDLYTVAKIDHLIVQTQKEENENDLYTVAKIDHGRSFEYFPENFKEFIDKISSSLSELGYQDTIDQGNLKFNIQEYSKALNTMIAGYDGNRVDNAIDRAVADLKKAGFEIGDLLSLKPKKDPSENLETIITNHQKSVEDRKEQLADFDNLAIYYRDLLSNNFNNIKQVAKDIEIVAKFSNVSEDFKNRGWVSELAESDYNNPIEYAIPNKIQIEGIDADKWQDKNKLRKEINGLGKIESNISAVKSNPSFEAKEVNPDTPLTESSSLQSTTNSAKLVPPVPPKRKYTAPQPPEVQPSPLSHSRASTNPANTTLDSRLRGNDNTTSMNSGQKYLYTQDTENKKSVFEQFIKLGKTIFNKIRSLFATKDQYNFAEEDTRAVKPTQSSDKADIQNNTHSAESNMSTIETIVAENKTGRYIKNPKKPNTNTHTPPVIKKSERSSNVKITRL